MHYFGDGINGLFESLGGILILLNCRQLYKDKQVKGVRVLTFSFFTAWGFWNLYYYPSLNQWLSFSGGVLIVIGNTLWVCMAVYYTKKNRMSSKEQKGILQITQ